MGDVAIRVENLSKKYTIKVGTQRHDGLSDLLNRRLKKLFRMSSSIFRQSLRAETIWSLKDVSFQVNHGEVIGIIGRNGAGKSTLLKILTHVTEPTLGRALIYGRVGCLLEVGTGFHPELTGRENVYLSGAILGMRKSELDKKFDEIVAFADTEKFLDTPVKHYSSGMYVRLAFAVAAHLDPEILIIDEVLAVGDAAFQQKCLGKMGDVAKEGRTVLFVSHNMSAVTRLCNRAILLDEGSVLDDGPSHKVVHTYLGFGVSTMAAREWIDPAKAPGGEVARLRAVRVRTEDGQITDTVDIRRPVGIEMEFEVLMPGRVMLPNYDFYNEEGLHVFGTIDLDPDWRRIPRPAGHWVSTAWIPGNFLCEGRLLVSAGVETVAPSNIEFFERDVVAFLVVDSLDGDSARGDWGGQLGGAVRPLLKWCTQYNPV